MIRNILTFLKKLQKIVTLLLIVLAVILLLKLQYSINKYDQLAENLQGSILQNLNKKIDINSIDNSIKSNEVSSQSSSAINEELEIKKLLRVYDLNIKNNFTFECVKSALIYVQTTICIHDIGNDIWISKAIKYNGVWEGDIVNLFMKILANNKNLNVIDIGANLGQYSLYAAKLNRKVISIEPFYDNIIRLHKSSQIEDISNNIILITNGVSDKRGEIKRLNKDDTNIGGQGIVDYNDLEIKSRELALKDKYNLVTILLNDLVTIIPVDFNEAIIKIDIENHELQAFKKIDKLLNRVKVYAIFMEWSDKSQTNINDVLEFLSFMNSNSYKPKNLLIDDLNTEGWRQWPRDIVWIRNDFKLKY